MGELTLLLAAVRAGEPGAVDRVVAMTYDELHTLAHRRLSRSPSISLMDTTSLVHECYLRLVKVGELNAADRPHFMGYAARTMRSIIVDLLRRRRADRHGGNRQDLTLETNIVADSAATDQVLNLDAALEGLAKFDRRLAEVVELRYFAGLTNGEIAETLGVNERTVRRDWDKARLLLHRELVPDLGRN